MPCWWKRRRTKNNNNNNNKKKPRNQQQAEAQAPGGSNKKEAPAKQQEGEGGATIVVVVRPREKVQSRFAILVTTYGKVLLLLVVGSTSTMSSIPFSCDQWSMLDGFETPLVVEWRNCRVSLLDASREWIHPWPTKVVSLPNVCRRYDTVRTVRYQLIRYKVR